MVNVNVALSPPLLQPRSPARLLGVWTRTLAVPVAEIDVAVNVAFNCTSLTNVVAICDPFNIITEAESKWLPFTVKTKLCCVCARVAELGVSDVITGAGLAVRQTGFNAWQPARNNMASTTTLSDPKEMRDGKVKLQ